ncbi:hypothetical protein Poly51_39660 [Rubripirellula tenax]|uniref:Uncharacterized protein n=1 Tax=Rubripirellula tenax TaxID=2528015 RepID=A0A5C6ELR3_9BACT|nr:hypothetical protein Poly51_39660 [Rubripirellula tenax]
MPGSVVSANMVFTLGLRHTFVGRQRALALVQLPVIQTPPLRLGRCRKNLPLCAAVFRCANLGHEFVSSTDMTSYLAHHTKKKQILARKEAALQRLIDSAAPDRKLIAAAEEVRDARIRVLHVQRSVIVPKGDADTQYAKIDAKIERIAETTAIAILSEFGCAIDADGDVTGRASGT